MEGLSACECPVCFLLLNHSTHEPMSMPCGHTLCKVCVQQLADRATNTVTRMGVAARPTFQCPICRQWVNVDTVSLNVTLRDLLAELGRMEEKRALPLGTALNVVYSEVEVEEVLDRGAFGEVCKGQWRGNEVAVKLFSTGRPTPETMEAFQREVFVMNCLRHPNVVLLLGACQTPPKLAIIMEFVAGGSLHQLLHVNKRSLSVVETAQSATDICRGLQYLHSINVLHRDMKSKNVLLTGPIPCQVKLCDFGLSRMRQESATMTGNIGTVHWTAPEVLNNQRYRFSADVYGFGMVLYEMVSGRVPLGHMVPMAVMLAVAVRKERPVVPDNAHPTLQQLIRECSEWEAGDRPSLPSILASLVSLLPNFPVRGEREQGEGRGKEHQDSLGVVFLSATDSADLDNQDSSLARLARQNQAPPPTQPQQTPVPGQLHNRPSYEDLFLSPDSKTQLPAEELTSLNMSIALNPSYPMARAQQALPRRRQALGEGNAPWPQYSHPQLVAGREGGSGDEVAEREGDGGDEAMARELQAQFNAQLHLDLQLAQQLQMRENSFQLPQATDPVASQTSVFPPQPLLDTIKKKKFPPLKHVQATPTETTPTEAVSIRKRIGSLLTKVTKKKIQPQPATGNSSNVVTPPRMGRLKKEPPSFGDYQNIPGRYRNRDYITPSETHTVGAMAGSSRAPPPPPPPPPRPPGHRLLSPRQVLLREVQTRAPTVARQLRPVQTIEKRAFRVGHVVGGYDPQQSLYTTQNLIQSFNRRRLRPVTLREPASPFPVGRVVQSRVRVKRMSSHLETTLSPPVSDTSVPPPLPPLPSSPPRRRLHPAIRSAVERFSRADLHHVQTIVKQKLPEKGEVEQEKRSKVIQEILEFDHSLLTTVHTICKNRLPSADVLEIERRQAVDSDLTHTRDLVLHSVLTFDPSGLHHVVTEVKSRLPSIGTIELEKRNIEH